MSPFQLTTRFDNPVCQSCNDPNDPKQIQDSRQSDCNFSCFIAYYKGWKKASYKPNIENGTPTHIKEKRKGKRAAV